MTTEAPAASPLSDPALLAAERRRRERAERERARADAVEAAAPRGRSGGRRVATLGDALRAVESEPEARRATLRAPATPAEVGAHARRPRRQRVGEPPVEHVADAPDSGYPRIAEGAYRVALSACAQRELWGRWRWLLTWTVVEGPAQGVELPQYLPRPTDPTARPRPGWALAHAYRVARGERLPKNLARLCPRVYLANAVFEARVRDVTRDSYGAEVAPAARYSRITALERRITGGGSSR